MTLKMCVNIDPWHTLTYTLGGKRALDCSVSEVPKINSNSEPALACGALSKVLAQPTRAA
jgi:hypothetical protein